MTGQLEGKGLITSTRTQKGSEHIKSCGKTCTAAASGYSGHRSPAEQQCNTLHAYKEKGLVFAIAFNDKSSLNAVIFRSIVSSFTYFPILVTPINYLKIIKMNTC